MPVRTRGVSAMVGAVVVAVALGGCNDSGSGKGGPGSASDSSAGKTTYRLGEASPPQESTMQRSLGSKFTVTPMTVRTGTKADLADSGLETEKNEGPKVPVYVWVTLALKSGKPMEVGDMDEDLLLKTNVGDPTKAPIVLLGQAKWPNCPTTDSEQQLKPGQSQKICTAFLIPESETVTAVELSQGFYDAPLEWPVTP